MITNFEDLRQVLKLVFVGNAPPSPLHLVEPLSLIRNESLSLVEAARLGRTTIRRLQDLADAQDPVVGLLGATLPSVSPEVEARIRGILGQLVIGNLAESVFEDIYRSTVGSTDLELRDDRTTRGDTDYLVYNGHGRQVFRINIKFHGSLFRRAKDLVGLEPEDCFALATYKIYSALRKQDTEHLPYIFVIVGVAGLTGPLVGNSIPDDLVHLSVIAHASRRVTGKRLIEDQIVDRLTTDPSTFGIEDPLRKHLSRIREAEWFVLSARRADNLLRHLLFERAFALRVRSFARNYRGAELDMHFSLSKDLRPLDELFEVLRESGTPGLTARLERGTL